jgi:hypothetical protein
MKDESSMSVPEHYITLRAENIEQRIWGKKIDEAFLTDQSSAEGARSVFL